MAFSLKFKSFSISLVQFFLNVGQNNFGNKIPYPQRFFFKYLEDFKRIIAKSLTCIFCFLDLNLEEYLLANRAIKDWNDIESLQILSKADVIGLTTTGAAKNFQLLRMLNPEIMIFEESGQVLESHVLSSLTPNLKKLILIGDHQQLKPSVSTYALAKGQLISEQIYAVLNFPEMQRNIARISALLSL